VGKVSHRVRVPVNFSGEVCALEVVVGGALVVSRGEEVDDDVPRDERDSMVTTVASIASRGRR
jgi:hypothetical protein